MKRITLFLAGLLLLTSCADTVATPEVSYRTRFTIKNSSQSDLAFQWTVTESGDWQFWELYISPEDIMPYK